MKQILIALLIALFSTPVFAGVPCTLPFTLTNGTVIDATQVMANYNALVTCLGSAAAAGINSDITALTGLTTPLAPVQGGSSTFLGSAASGTDAIVIASTTPSNFTLTANNKVRFIAGGANDASTTLSVGATGVKNLYRQTPGGPAPMVGGEIVAGQSVEVIYDGTQYQMTSLPALNYPPGAVFDYAAAAGCPVGSLETTGDSTFSQAAFPTLFTLLGTTWGAAAGGNFTIPDLRGRGTFSRDSGASARITVAGGNFDGTVVGGTGGQQSKVVNKVNLAAFALNVTDTHIHTVNFSSSGATGTAGIGGGSTSGGLSTSTTTTSSGSIAVASGGSATPLPTLSNAAIVVKCIKG